MKTKNLLVFGAFVAAFVVVGFVLINGCGKSLIGSTATSSQQAQTALDNGNYTTAVTEATKVIDNPSSTSAEKGDAYSVVGQAQLGDVLSSKNTNTVKVMTAVSDNINTKGENLSAVAPDLIIEPTLTAISNTSSMGLLELPTISTIESQKMIDFVTKIKINVTNDKYQITSPDAFKKIYAGLVAVENAFNYWNTLDGDKKSGNLSTAFVEDISIITTLVSWAFSSDHKKPIEFDTDIDPEVSAEATGPDKLKERWFKINDVDPSTITGLGSSDIQSKFRDSIGGVTNRIYHIVTIVSDEAFNAGKDSAGLDQKTTLITNAQKIKDKIDTFNSLFWNGGKPTYTELNKYLIKKTTTN